MPKVIETFKDCASLPDKGWSLQFPPHPKGLQVSIEDYRPVYTTVLTRVQLTSGREPSSNPPIDVG